MKFISILTVSILFMSCGATSSQSQQSKNDDENWVMTNHTFTTNTYTKTGLLDTSYQAMVAYEMGIEMDTIKSIVLRKYEGSKLTNERGFTIEKDGSKTLSYETIKQYDSKGNLITEIDMMDSNMLSKMTNEYNSGGQVIKSINLFRKMNNDPNQFILDSAIAHYNDRKHFEYDTTIFTNEYDATGNQIRTILYDTKGRVLETTSTQYSGNEKTFSFSLTPQGDTTGTLIFQHDGKLIKQINDMKQMNAVDTSWLDNNKTVKTVGHNHGRKYKDVTTYNDKGDEIESVSYK